MKTNINRSKTIVNDLPINPYESKFWVKNYPEHIPTEIKIPEINLFEILDNTAENHGNRPAIYFLGKRMKYKKLKKLTDKLATALVNLGLKKGDRVGLLMPNFPQYIIAYFGILKAGGIVVPCNTLYKKHELLYQLNDSAAEILITHDAHLEKINKIRDSTNLRHVIISNVFDYSPLANPNPPKLKGYVQLLTLIRKTKPNIPKFKTNAKEDVAILQYTGGTTGLPKGAMLTHYNLISAAYIMYEWVKPTMITAKETVLTQLTLSHIFGMSVCMNICIKEAGCLALNPDPRDHKSFFEVMRDTRPTHMPGVPRIYMNLLEREDFKDYVKRFKTLKICISGAAPMPPETMKEFESITGAKILEGYGMSETSAAGISNPLYGKRKFGSVGSPHPGIDIKIVDIDDYTKIMPLGESGELMIKSPTVMKGYWDRPEETAEQLKEDGWILTGDIARMDNDGYVFIVDRKKDMLNISGFKVYPQEVENLLIEHEAVEDAAVIGLPNPNNPGSNIIKAFIVLKTVYSEGYELMEDIRQFCRKNLAPYKVPKQFEFRKELPQTKLMKLSRKDLKNYEAFQRGEEI
ncbi:MAG: long-chain fatty acid--CoA ligase [Promethearchaeota archaeon]